jgi:hypothetical protein
MLRASLFMTFEQTPRDDADDEVGGVARQRPSRLHPLLVAQLKRTFGAAEAVPRE